MGGLHWHRCITTTLCAHSYPSALMTLRMSASETTTGRSETACTRRLQARRLPDGQPLLDTAVTVFEFALVSHTKTQLYGGGLLVLCSRRRQDLKLVEGPVAAGWVACSELARTRLNTTKPSPAPLSLPLIQKPYDPAAHDPWHAGGDSTAPPRTRPTEQARPRPRTTRLRLPQPGTSD